MTPAIIDVTPSGAGPAPFPVEIGVALADGRCHCFLIRPEEHWLRDSPQASPLYGLEQSLLLSHGTPIQEVAIHLNELLRGQSVYCQEWGQATTLISRLFYDARAIQMFMIESLHHILDPVMADEWERLQYKIREEMTMTRHRASSEALMAQKVYNRGLSP